MIRKPKVTTRVDRLYFCGKCLDYYWHTKEKGVRQKHRSMWRPEGMAKPQAFRTCKTCRRNNA